MPERGLAALAASAVRARSGCPASPSGRLARSAPRRPASRGEAAAQDRPAPRRDPRRCRQRRQSRALPGPGVRELRDGGSEVGRSASRVTSAGGETRVLTARLTYRNARSASGGAVDDSADYPLQGREPVWHLRPPKPRALPGLVSVVKLNSRREGGGLSSRPSWVLTWPNGRRFAKQMTASRRCRRGALRAGREPGRPSSAHPKRISHPWSAPASDRRCLGGRGRNFCLRSLCSPRQRRQHVSDDQCTVDMLERRSFLQNGQ